MCDCVVGKLEVKMAVLDTRSKNQEKKVNEIHKALMGNGQPGLLAEWNQWKGTVKFLGTIVGISISLLGICIGALAYIK